MLQLCALHALGLGRHHDMVSRQLQLAAFGFAHAHRLTLTTAQSKERNWAAS